MRGKSTLLPEQSKKFPEFYKKLNPNWTDEQCIEAAKQFKKNNKLAMYRILALQS